MDKFDEALVERLGKTYVQVGREDLYKRQYPEIYAEGYRPWELPSYTISDAEWQSVYAGIRAVLTALSETHAIVAKAEYEGVTELLAAILHDAERTIACHTPGGQHVVDVPKMPLSLAQHYKTAIGACLAKLPCELWRVCDNPKSNDFNKEPNKLIKHYRIFAHDRDAGKYWVELDGWHGFKQRHWVDAKSCYFTREEAEKEATPHAR